MSDQADKSFKITLENGICRYDLFREVSIESVLAAEREIMKLIDEKGIKLVPIVAVLSDVDDDHVKLKLEDFAKILQLSKLVDRASGVWIVGSSGRSKWLGVALNNLFLSGRIHFAETLQEAMEDAKKAKDSTVPILEERQDTK
jgi:hypothetical protein